MVHLSVMSKDTSTQSQGRAGEILGWIAAVGESAGVNGATYIGEQMESEPRVVRKLAGMGKLPPDWWERCDAIGRHYGVPPSRDWFFKRRARQEPLVRDAAPVDVRLELRS